MKIFNRKLKITSSALLTLCMVFVMTACAENSSQSEKSQPAEQTTVQPTTMSAEEINDRKLDKFISDMTLEEKVGQMFFVRCPDEDAVQQVSEYNIGGYILFGRDFDGKTKDEVVDDIHSYQNEADIPLLIGVDEEGGTVVRVSSNPILRETPFLSPKDTYADGGWDAVKQDTEESNPGKYLVFFFSFAELFYIQLRFFQFVNTGLLFCGNIDHWLSYQRF